jgi:hypothetical protein
MSEPYTVLASFERQSERQAAEDVEIAFLQLEPLGTQGRDESAARVGVEVCIEDELGLPDIEARAFALRRCGVIRDAQERLSDNRNVGIDRTGVREPDQDDGQGHSCREAELPVHA